MTASGDEYAGVRKWAMPTFPLPSGRGVDCYFEYLKVIQDWNSKHGWHFHILDYAMHFDENTPHVHYSPLMDVKDKDGHFIIAQEKALREAGIELPDPSKPEGRYNNRKITFDKISNNLRYFYVRIILMGY